MDSNFARGFFWVIRQISVNGGIQVDEAFFDHLQDQDGGERLGDGPDKVLVLESLHYLTSRLTRPKMRPMIAPIRRKDSLIIRRSIAIHYTHPTFPSGKYILHVIFYRGKSAFGAPYATVPAPAWAISDGGSVPIIPSPDHASPA